MLLTLNKQSLIHTILLLNMLIVFAFGAQLKKTTSNAIQKEYTRKHWKRLKKQDGAVRLVGGRHEHEGMQIVISYINHK